MSELQTHKPEARFALKNGPRQPHLLGPKSPIADMNAVAKQALLRVLFNPL